MPALEHTATDSVLIVVECNGGRTITHPLGNGESILIGADDQCRLRVPDKSVSPKHCLVRLQDQEVLLQDWCSLHGTLVNGESIDGIEVISPGDRVQLGDCHMTITYPHFQESKESFLTESTGAQEILQRTENTVGAEQRDAHEKIATAAPTSSTRGASDFSSRQPCHVPSVEQSTIELLKSEIELLQSCLSEKDAQLAELTTSSNSSVERDGWSSVELERRIQRLLHDLDQSDQRVAALEEVSRLSEETSRADAEEKRQLEAWVHDIEKLISEREAESQAECDVLRQRLNEAVEEQKRSQGQIDKLLRGNGGNPALDEMVEVLRMDNDALRDRIALRDAELDQLKKTCAELRQRASQEFIQRRIDETLRAERLLLAQERAEFSRQQLELTNRVHDLKQEMERQQKVHPADSRFHAFRERLKELHEQEKAEYVPPTVTQRLVRLWQRLDGPTDRD